MSREDGFDLAGQMEPGAKAFGDKFGLDPWICAHLSIAISLKRIADSLDGTAVGVDISQSLAGVGLGRKA